MSFAKAKESGFYVILFIAHEIVLATNSAFARLTSLGASFGGAFGARAARIFSLIHCHVHHPFLKINY